MNFDFARVVFIGLYLVGILVLGVCLFMAFKAGTAYRPGIPATYWLASAVSGAVIWAIGAIGNACVETAEATRSIEQMLEKEIYRQTNKG